MTWIDTWTGKLIHPLDPRPESICLEDIVQGLSNKTRYNGQCEFYSVAEHCILLSDWCTKIGLNALIAINILLHDSGEAYLPDVTSPIKGLFPDFKECEDRMLRVIFQALGIEMLESDIYLQFQKHVDRSIVLNEREVVMPNHPNTRCWGMDKLNPLPGIFIKKWPPQIAKSAFVNRFHMLKRKIR